MAAAEPTAGHSAPRYITVSDSPGYRVANNVQPIYARHLFYHVIVSEPQRHALEGSLKNLNISFGSERNPVNFEHAKKQMDSLQKTLNREQSDHGQTRKLRQMEKETLQSIFDSCVYKYGHLEESALRENPGDPAQPLKKNAQFMKFLETTMNCIEGVQKKTKREHEEYMKNKRQQDEDRRRKMLKETMQKKYMYTGYLAPETRVAEYAEVKAPQRGKETKEEGAISALDLLGGSEDDDGLGSIFEEVKNEAVRLDGGKEASEEQEEEEPGANTISAQRTFRAALERQVSETAQDEHDLTATSPTNIFEDSTDDDAKPPILDTFDAGEPPKLMQPRMPIYRRVVCAQQNSSGEPLAKRPRILGGSSGMKYRVLTPSTVPGTPPPRYTGRYSAVQPGPHLTDSDMQMSKMHSVNTVAGLPVTLRPSSSTDISAEMREQLVADALNKHSGSDPKPVVQRVQSTVFRRDYKNPPAPLPADDGTHVLCHLCDNRIMCTRLSNLTNHVRRHSAVKQYQCIHCHYQHNEQAKVRMHMHNNHGDSVSQPEDNLTKDMQRMWSLLMEECFPGYLEQLRQAQPAAAVVDWDRQGIMKNRGTEFTATTLDDIHSCLECGEAISVNPSSATALRIEPLLSHIEQQHRDLCRAYKCLECGYANSEEYKVRWHVSRRHTNLQSSEVDLEVADEGEHMDLFVYKFFPSIEKVLGERDDPDEEELKKAMGGSTEATPLSMTMGMPPAPPVKTMMKLERFDAEDGGRTIMSGDEKARIDPTTLTDKQVLCELCNKVLDWTNRNTLCSLLAHAKRHFKIKQFQCSICDYASSESAHVKNHMLQRHNSTHKHKENNNDFMQTSWLNVMRKCFPPLRERIDSFKFKSVRQYSPDYHHQQQQQRPTSSATPPDVEVKTEPPTHGYHTRGKRVATDFDL